MKDGMVSIDLKHDHRPIGWDAASFAWTGGTYEMRGAVPIVCGDEQGTATALVYRFDMLNGRRGIGTLSVDVDVVPDTLRATLQDGSDRLAVAVDISGLVVLAGSYLTRCSRSERGPVSFTVGPVKRDDVVALIERLKWPTGNEHVSALEGGARGRLSCRHSMQSAHVKDGVMGCEDCDLMR